MITKLLYQHIIMSEWWKVAIFPIRLLSKLLVEERLYLPMSLIKMMLYQYLGQIQKESYMELIKNSVFGIGGDRGCIQ